MKRVQCPVPDCGAKFKLTDHHINRGELTCPACKTLLRVRSYPHLAPLYVPPDHPLYASEDA